MMPSCKMNETKLEVTENYEEADLSDVDDDVFVRSGGRSGYCLEYDIAKKPLMTPRKKSVKFVVIILLNNCIHCILCLNTYISLRLKDLIGSFL